MSRITSIHPLRICFAFLIWSIFITWIAPAMAGPIEKNVLFISSYHPGFPTFYQQIQGVESVLDGRSVRMDVEFMDSKRFGQKAHLDNFYRMLSYKLARLKKYDLILTADDNALHFVLDHQEDLFKDTPVIFFGINNVELARAQNSNPWVTGVVEAVSMADTVALTIRLDPQVKRIVALVDGTASGQGDLETFHRIGRGFKNLDFAEISLTGLSFNELGEQLNKLTRTDALLLLSAYRDKTGKTLLFDDSLKLIKNNYKGPVYHLWIHGLGDGILGGKVISHYQQGKTAAEMAAAVLAGKPVRDIPVIEESPNKYCFDYQELKRIGLLSSPLPPGSLVINQPQVLYSLPKGVFWLILALVISLFSLVLVMGLNARRRRKIEQALRLSEERFREIVEVTDDLITRVDSTGRFTYVSPAAKKIYGVEAETCLGKLAFDYIHPDDRQKTMDAFQVWLSDKIDAVRFENRQLNRKGHSYNILWAINFHYDEAGNLTSISSIGRDITDLRLAEEKLAWEGDLNALMADLSQALIEAASTEDIHGLILRRAQNMTGSRLGYAGYWDRETGRLADHILSRDGDPVRDPEEKNEYIKTFERICRWTLENKQSLLSNSHDPEPGAEDMSPRPSPISRFLSSPAIVRDQLLGVIALADSDRNYSYRDLTLVERLASLYALAVQRQNAAEALSKALTAAEVASRAKTEFLANISHELRTPLIPVIGVTDMLLDTENDLEKRSFLTDVKKSGQNLLRLIDDLIELSRMEADGIDPRLELFRLDSLLKLVVISMTSAARDKNIELKTIIEPDVPLAILGDERLLAMILSKIGDNAIKFTQDGKILISVDIFEITGNTVRLLFSIADTGVGIPESHRELLFQDFTQADGSKTRRHGGLGLGMTIVRRSVQVLGGEISVESVEGLGSIFHVVIPFELPEGEGDVS